MSTVYDALLKTLDITSEAFSAKLAEQRFIPIQGMIDPEMANGICKVMLAMDFQKTAPITLLLSSGGGDVVAGKNIEGTISALNSPVDGLVVTQASSMAVDILLMCRRRKALPSAGIFVHFTRCSFKVICDNDEITPDDIEALKMKMASDKWNRTALYAQRLKKTKEQVYELFRRGEKFNLTYNAQESLEIGLIDEIVQDFKFFAPQTQ